MKRLLLFPALAATVAMLCMVRQPSIARQTIYTPRTARTTPSHRVHRNSQIFFGPRGIYVGSRVCDPTLGCFGQIDEYFTLDTNSPCAYIKTINPPGLQEATDIIFDNAGTMFVADRLAGKVFILTPPYMGPPLFTIAGLLAPTGLALDDTLDGISNPLVLWVAGGNQIKAFALVPAGPRPIPVAVNPPPAGTRPIANPYGITVTTFGNDLLFNSNTSTQEISAWDTGPPMHQGPLTLKSWSAGPTFAFPPDPLVPGLPVVPTGMAEESLVAPGLDQFLVADWLGGRIFDIVFPGAGAGFRTVWADPGIARALGIDMDQNGVIYVASSGNKTVRAYTNFMFFTSSFIAPTCVINTLGEPAAVRVGPQT